MSAGYSAHSSFFPKLTGSDGKSGREAHDDEGECDKDDRDPSGGDTEAPQAPSPPAVCPQHGPIATDVDGDRGDVTKKSDEATRLKDEVGDDVPVSCEEEESGHRGGYDKDGGEERQALFGREAPE
jgi:hypothetical protein